MVSVPIDKKLSNTQRGSQQKKFVSCFFDFLSLFEVVTVCSMAKVYVTRRIPSEVLDYLKSIPEIKEVRVNPENRVLTREGNHSKFCI
jgi:hypothetical protein